MERVRLSRDHTGLGQLCLAGGVAANSRLREAMEALLTPQQLADAQQRATDWLTAFEQRN